MKTVARVLNGLAVLPPEGAELLMAQRLGGQRVVVDRHHVVSKGAGQWRKGVGTKDDPCSIDSAPRCINAQCIAKISDSGGRCVLKDPDSKPQGSCAQSDDELHRIDG